jgi:hypothetical protein
MNHIDALYKDFPVAMREVYCGAYAGKGWIEPLRKAVAVLDKAGYQVVQIKQKFGELRIYFEPSENTDIWTNIACTMAVKQAELACNKMCEECGAPAETNYYVTLCTTCSK